MTDRKKMRQNTPDIKAPLATDNFVARGMVIHVFRLISNQWLFFNCRYRYDHDSKYELSNLQKLYHLANDIKNLSRDIHLTGTFAPQSDKEEIQKEISTTVEQFDKIKTKYKDDNNTGEAPDKVLAIYGETIKKTLESLPTDILPSNVDSLTDIGDKSNGEIKSIVVPTHAPAPEKPTPSAVTDIFAPLNKKCTPEEIKLIRKKRGGVYH